MFEEEEEEEESFRGNLENLTRRQVDLAELDDECDVSHQEYWLEIPGVIESFPRERGKLASAGKGESLEEIFPFSRRETRDCSSI